MNKPTDFFTAEQVMKATGVSERCLHYWDVTKVVSPRRPADGSGIYRGYTRADTVCLSVVKRMRDAGVSLQRIRKHVPHIRRAVKQATDQGTVPLVLIQKGNPLILVRGPAEEAHAGAIIDALKGGQLVLAVDLEPIAQEVSGRLKKPRWRQRKRSSGT